MPRHKMPLEICVVENLFQGANKCALESNTGQLILSLKDILDYLNKECVKNKEVN